MTIKNIYLVRHGQTNHNHSDLVQDETSTLSEAGITQAQRVAERLAHIDFGHLVVSDYERTRQTAVPIAELTKIAPVFSPLFREIRRPSEFFNQPRQSEGFQNFLADEFKQFALDESWRHSDEENFSDVSQRVTEAFTYLASLDGDIVVVSHGHFIRRMVASVAMNMEIDGATWQKMYRSFRAVNTGITTLQYDSDEDHWQIFTFNDIAHFAE